ncbi:MAG: hypothetical protein A2202_05885 [Bdellovibrionales bacterium RIFOXYA1_FULL_36_14]|nr:MAG: hypothetical protein A2202_05885 [Bdellovibrionales bacterium RIFOXYA1_FULL_36_14]
MFSFLVPVATLLPLLYYIGELPIFKDIKNEHKSIAILILVLASLSIWIALAISSLNYNPILLTGFFKVEIGYFKLPVFFKIDRVVLFFIFANISVFLHPLVVNLFYRSDVSFKWFPVGLSAITLVILAGNVLVLFFSMTTLSLCFLIDDILKSERILQNKGAWIFIFQRVLDIVAFILLVLMLFKISRESINLSQFTFMSYEKFLGSTSGFWIVIILLLKVVTQILDVLIFSTFKSAERLFTEMSAGLLMLIYIIARFVFVIDQAPDLKTIIILGIFPFLIYIGWILIQEKNFNKILGAAMIGFFLNVIVAMIVQSAGMSLYLTLASIVMIAGLYVHIKYIEMQFSKENIDNVSMVQIGPWHRTYLIISFLVMFIPPGCGIIGAITNIMWNQMHSNEMIFIGFFYTLSTQSILVWFLARMFFGQLTTQKNKNIPKEKFLYKITLVVFALLIGMVILLNVPFDIWFIRKHIFLIWYDKFYLRNLAIPPINLWFMILWSLFFVLLSMSAYIVYYAKKEDFNFDRRLAQKIKPLKELFKNIINLFFKKVSYAIAALIKVFFVVVTTMKKQNYGIVAIICREVDKKLGLITVFELRTPGKQLGVYLWMLLLILLAVFFKW